MKPLTFIFLLVNVIIISSGFETRKIVKVQKSTSIDFTRLNEKIAHLKLYAADKAYTEGACTIPAQDTTSARAGTKCFETTGRCSSAKACEAIPGQTNGIVPTLQEIQTMADNHGQLMYTLNFTDLEDIPFSVAIAYNSLKSFYGYP